MFDGLVDYLNQHEVDLDIIDIAPNNKRGLLRILDFLFTFIGLFFKLLSTRYDLIYITTAQSKKGFLRDCVLIRICALFKKRIVAHQYGANYCQLLDSLGIIGRKNLAKMWGYVSCIIVEGQHMKNQFSFLTDFEEKVRIIPNGLPSVGRNALTVKKYTGESPFKLFYLSNLIWSKGFYDVLEAVDLLVNKYKRNISCTFAGAFMTAIDDASPCISNKDGFDRYVKVHRLEDNVTYFPGLYGEQKDEFFSQANVFLLPTYYINEGQPVSIIEAMAYGCVPIVTYFRHIPMMVTNENGCFVKPRSPEQIAETIQKLMDKPDEYSAKSFLCIKDYKDKFTFNKYASEVMKCMMNVK